MHQLHPNSFKKITSLHINPIAKVFIVSESFFWSGWNILLPLISLFAIKQITNATVETISFSYSVYLLLRVVGSIASGFISSRLSAIHKNWLIMVGILVINIAYMGLISATSIPAMYVFYGLAGICTGVVSPLRAALFSTHMDKNEETTEWGLLDAIVLTTIAISTAISGIMVGHFGYKSVFILATILNTVSIIPYMYLLRSSHALTRRSATREP